MKTHEQIKPNYAPVYCAAMYPQLCEIFQRHGYALAVHGSLSRDFDLIAVPWTDNVSDVVAVLAEVVSTFAVRIIGDEEIKPHGRIAFTFSVGFGECACDLSFMPNTGCEAR